MEKFKMVEILGKAFAEGDIDALISLIADDCIYSSQYAKKTIQGAKAILLHMRAVYADINEISAYTYNIIELESVLQIGLTLKDLEIPNETHVCKYGLLLYQYDLNKPVVVVICGIDNDEKLTSILLCRDKKYFNLSFYGEEVEKDSPDDIPSTVVPLTKSDRRGVDIRNLFRAQKWEEPVDTSDGNYIWRKADEYVEKWLPSKGYTILESAVFDDCIGYRCKRNDHAYTVFMYAYGIEKTSQLDGEFCSKLAELPFAENSIILVLYLNVYRYMDGTEIKYRVRDYSKVDKYEPNLWRLIKVNDVPILQYYPCKEMLDQALWFIYAFNNDDTDVYDCIIDENPSIEGIPGSEGVLVDEAFYEALLSMHKKYGDLKLGYVSYDDVIYSSVPYLEGIGFFIWSSYININRMHSMSFRTFEDKKRRICDFIKTEQREPDDLFDHIPKLINAIALAPVPTEKFAVKLLFSNGECKKYVLPIPDEDIGKEVISYMCHVFTDGIWASVFAVSSHASMYKGYPECGPAITFKNEFFISGIRCYLDGEPYSEPEYTNEIVYSDEKFKIRKIWQWHVSSIYEDEETGLLKVIMSEQANNRRWKSAFVSVDGKLIRSRTFDFIDSFQEGLARAAIFDKGYGFINKDMNLIVPIKYDEAESFVNGKAKVRLGNRWLFVDKAGNELEIGKNSIHAPYQEVGNYYEGMCRVSILNLELMDFAFHMDYRDIAGCWGFVNKAGEEVISPQYIYANDFEDGIAIVAKGEWTIYPEGDRKDKRGCYWSEVELWGGIDKNGNEIIPFIFDEIKLFADRNDIFMAHHGGWKNGHWGVIDRTGNWLVEPIFDDHLDWESWNNLITFYSIDNDIKEEIVGVYDISEKKVLFEPQFLDLSFCDNGDMLVKVFNKDLGRPIEKIIDRSGKERFKSIYSYIYTWKEPYEVVIRDKDGYKRGLIDENGSIIIPCAYDIPSGGFFHDVQKHVFLEDGKQGLKDYSGNTIIPAIYYRIDGYLEPFITVKVGDENNYSEGLITFDGTSVIPANYERIIWCKDKKHFFCFSDGYCEMYVVEQR
jgi:hypothetical protein